MFEKRLKIFLLVLSTVVILLLMRAAQLQVLEAAEWRLEASRTLQHRLPLPTIRGSILDRNGEILAKDTACVDACVEYAALTPTADPKWLQETSLSRLKQRLGEDGWLRIPRPARRKMLEDEMTSVQTLLNSMWQRLADISQKSSDNSGKTEEEIERIRQSVQHRVELQKKYIWWESYQHAMKDAKPKADDPKWQKWLTGSGEEEPDEIDKYAVTVSGEREAHVILHDINIDVQNDIARHPEMFPGLKLMPGVRRLYPYDDVAAHVLGHLGGVLKEDLKNNPEQDDETRRYLPNDQIGRAGLELLCEPALRGTQGMTMTRGDDATRNQSTPPIPGQDVRASIDINLQRDIQAFFGDATISVPKADSPAPEIVHHQVLHGAAVLLDVQTNQVLALVTYPSYDANKYDQDYQTLLEDQRDDALRNRATQSQLEPGSTVKPLVGLSGITQGVVKVNEGIECTGYLRLPDSHGKMFTLLQGGRCWVASGFATELGGQVAHHPIPPSYPHRGHDGNLDGFLTYSDGLERSCNVYFETVADRLGIVSLTAWMRRFGLGAHTGIGIEEYKGRVPADAKENFGLRRRTTGFMAGIGQGYIAVTPIQMANVASTIARGGIWMRPQLVLPDLKTGHIPRLHASTESIPDRVDLHLDPAAVAACHKGMFEVVNDGGGTGQKARMSDLVVAGKTGTAQAAEFKTVLIDSLTHQPVLDRDGHKQWVTYALSTLEHPNPEVPWYRGWGKDGKQIDHAWMIGFAPADKPKIAFAVLVEYGGSGGGAAADVVRASLESCILHGYLKPVLPTAQPVAVAGTELLTGQAAR